jgi:hypothetical protein
MISLWSCIARVHFKSKSEFRRNQASFKTRYVCKVDLNSMTSVCSRAYLRSMTTKQPDSHAFILFDQFILECLQINCSIEIWDSIWKNGLKTSATQQFNFRITTALNQSCISFARSRVIWSDEKFLSEFNTTGTALQLFRQSRNFPYAWFLVNLRSQEQFIHDVH